MESQIREKILKAVLQSITRNGIRAFRVEDLTHHLKISKKTLYQLFPTRIDLVKKCIEKINEPARNKISFCLNAHKKNPMLRILNYTKSYVNGLYEPEIFFGKSCENQTNPVLCSKPACIMNRIPARFSFTTFSFGASQLKQGVYGSKTIYKPAFPFSPYRR